MIPLFLLTVKEYTVCLHKRFCQRRDCCNHAYHTATYLTVSWPSSLFASKPTPRLEEGQKTGKSPTNLCSFSKLGFCYRHSEDVHIRSYCANPQNSAFFNAVMATRANSRDRESFPERHRSTRNSCQEKTVCQKATKVTETKY